MKGKYLIMLVGILIFLTATVFAVYKFANTNENELQGVYVFSLTKF